MTVWTPDLRKELRDRWAIIGGLNADRRTLLWLVACCGATVLLGDELKVVCRRASLAHIERVIDFVGFVNWTRQ